MATISSKLKFIKISQLNNTLNKCKIDENSNWTIINAAMKSTRSDCPTSTLLFVGANALLAVSPSDELIFIKLTSLDLGHICLSDDTSLNFKVKLVSPNPSQTPNYFEIVFISRGAHRLKVYLVVEKIESR